MTKEQALEILKSAHEPGKSPTEMELIRKALSIVANSWGRPPQEFQDE